jgi:hypothetical protein
VFRRSIRGSATVALVAIAAAVLVPSAGASPVATNDAQYSGLGRVFPDPMGGCQRFGRSPCSPNAQGNLPADQFIQYDEFLTALRYMNQEPEWQRYMEVWPLDGKLGDGAGNGRDPDVPGNNLGSLEFTPSEAYQSAGLPTTNTDRQRHDLVVIRVTDETVPDAGKKRYTLSLSIHGIERAGVEGGTRAMEDLVTAHTTTLPNPDRSRANDPVIPRTIDPAAPTFDDVLKKTIIYFTYPNPDGWKRGSISSGGVFFQRYNGNGVDPNRDWPDIGFSFRPYSGLSEPESRSFAAFYDQVRSNGGSFSAGDDLHGQPEADALSFTLLPHGRHDYEKDIRIRETAKTIHENSEQALAWSPIIQPNDAPRGGGAPCAPGLGDACAKIYGQTWGSVYDTINYTTTGALGDYFDSSIGLGADGIDNEMSFSHLDKNIVFDPHTEQLHVDGNKALIYAHLAEIVAPATGKFDAPGRKGYVPNDRVSGGGGAALPLAPAGSKPHDPVDLGPEVGLQNPDPDGVAYPFTINGQNVFNGGMRVDVTATNIQGIATGVADLKVQCRGCDLHRSLDPAEKAPGDWITVAEDFNQAELPPVYAQAGLTAAINYPQAISAGGKPVEWRALVSRESGAPRVHVEFSSGRATTDGATGGDQPPATLRYDVANTDFFRDLDRHVEKRSEDFDTVDPQAVLDGRQALSSFESVALADDPLPGYTGEYGGRTRPTGPPTAERTYDGSAPTRSADAGPSVPGSAHRYQFETGVNDANASFTARIDWPSKDDDFDMRIYRIEANGSKTKVGESVSVGGTGNSEEATIPSPAPGKYEVEVHNYLANNPNFKGKVTFAALAFAGSRFTTAEKDQWAAKLREYVNDGGNLVLTDGALRLLPELSGIPDKAINRQTVYAGQTAFATAEGKSTVDDRLARNVDQPGARFNDGQRRQMYEPTPLGFAIQDPGGGDQSNAVQYDVDKAEWEKAGGRTAGTSADAGDRDAQAVYSRVTLGELKRGKGQIRIAGALLPQPTEKFDHPLGLEPYAVTYTGYIVVRNLFDTTARGLPGLPGAAGEAGRNFIISRRAVKLKKRIAAVRVSCRSPRGCKGTLVLKMRRIVRVRGKRRAKLFTVGKVKFNYPAKRRNAVLRVKLSGSGVKSARAKRRSRVVAVASVRFGDGTRAKPSRRFWLYRPSGSRR